jgi:hypothetical protein
MSFLGFLDHFMGYRSLFVTVSCPLYGVIRSFLGFLDHFMGYRSLFVTVSITFEVIS